MSTDFFSEIPKEAWPAIAAIIGALGMVFGAVLAFLGVWLNNLFENNRRERQRKHDLIRDTYFGAIDYIALSVCTFSQLIQKPMADFEQSHEALKKSYLLNLISTPEVMKYFLEFSDAVTKSLLQISSEKILIEKIQTEINSENTMRNLCQIRMDQLMLKHEKLVESDRFSKELSDFLLNQHAESLESFNESLISNDRLMKELVVKQMDLIKLTLVKMKEIMPLVHNVIFTMRVDLSFKFSKADSAIMKKLLLQSLQSAETSTNGFIKQLEDLLTQEMQRA